MLFCSLGAVVLRVPVLFGEVESLTESVITSLWLKVEATESCTLDHCQQRFPTDARDVAGVCRKLAERAKQVRRELLPARATCASEQFVPQYHSGHVSICLWVLPHSRAMVKVCFNL